MLCCAGADDAADDAATLAVREADLEALTLADADADEADCDAALDAELALADERDNIVDGRMMPEIVVAMLKASVG